MATVDTRASRLSSLRAASTRVGGERGAIDPFGALAQADDCTDLKARVAAEVNYHITNQTSDFEDFSEAEIEDLLAEIDLVCEDQDEPEYKCVSEYSNPPGCGNMSCECFGATDRGSIAWSCALPFVVESGFTSSCDGCVSE